MLTSLPGRICLTADGVELEIHSRVGEGGEGSVFHVGGRPDRVAKLYRCDQDPRDRRVRGRKLELLLAMGDERLRSAAAWPEEILYDGEGQVAGFTMPYLGGYAPLYTAYQIKSRLARMSASDFGFLVRVARNLAACVHFVHEAGLAAGDLNESNVLVTPGAMVRLIDVDGFQVREGGEALAAGVARPEYLAPELQGCDLALTERTADHDLFSLAVLIFQILAFGRHPYAGRPVDGGESPTLEDAIANGWYAYSDRRDRPIEAPPGMSLEYLGPRIRSLFEDAFSPGPGRPSAQAWHDALAEIEDGLEVCRENPSHRFWPACGDCPWCAFEARWRFALFVQPNGRADLSHGLDIAGLLERMEALEPKGILHRFPEPEELAPPRPPMGAAARTFWWCLSRINPFEAAIPVLCSGSLAVGSGIALVAGTALAAKKWIRHRASELDRFVEDYRRQWRQSASIEAFEERRNEIRTAAANLEAMPERREELRVEQLRRSHGYLLEAYLDRYSLAIADVQPKHRELVESLMERGVRTAADVLRPVLQRALSRQSSIVPELETWALSLERQFWQSSAHTLNPEGHRRVEEDLAREREDLYRRLTRAEQDLGSLSRQLGRNQQTLLREYLPVARRQARWDRMRALVA